MALVVSAVRSIRNIIFVADGTVSLTTLRSACISVSYTRALIGVIGAVASGVVAAIQSFWSETVVLLLCFL